MSFRDLSSFAGTAYDGCCGLPQIDVRRVGRILCVGALAGRENRSWCGPKIGCGSGLAQQCPELYLFSLLCVHCRCFCRFTLRPSTHITFLRPSVRTPTAQAKPNRNPPLGSTCRVHSPGVRRDVQLHQVGDAVRAKVRRVTGQFRGIDSFFTAETRGGMATWALSGTGTEQPVVLRLQIRRVSISESIRPGLSRLQERAPSADRLVHG